MPTSITHLTINFDIDRDGLIEIVVPELNGCYASGETIQEACVNLSEAIYLWLARQDALHFGYLD